MDCRIRLATKEDAAAISRIVITALRESNAQDYPAEVIAQVEKSFTPEAVAVLLNKRKVFVALMHDDLIATASLDGDVVRTVFVEPGHQGSGVGRKLMETIHAQALNADMLTLLVPSSLTAEGFYASMGYRKIRDELHGAERTIVMEKSLQTHSKHE
ncbi:L-amino acid N-acyltransferase YncA [Ectopseudomonas chengduensis]|uniref:L-amino acid N-acyltransferase YncA n=1 Tax=Ectopseudomonas chengduensis TaxID=489632 RepID=A0A1G6I9N6_9GAMM|nr:GNAT family N-acetyltransferase [Pseudomonas chengduensis]MBP3059714.1 GNAT family N-acetyltransferase [Pseudomonas chengduensis]NNB73270.1 GNAT family N-acetyltransferase [Pseudomonas chengduensis]SDC03204.1 L-amino acid N-acyltransferase YncA [Pseudomonas chengduensis]